MIYISEIYFDSSISVEDRIIQLDGYSSNREDHPSDTKGGGVCIHYKESLVVKVLDISFINECILCEVFVQNKRGYITGMYRFPSPKTLNLMISLTIFTMF